MDHGGRSLGRCRPPVRVIAQRPFERESSLAICFFPGGFLRGQLTVRVFGFFIQGIICPDSPGMRGGWMTRVAKWKIQAVENTAFTCVVSCSVQVLQRPRSNEVILPIDPPEFSH